MKSIIINEDGAEVTVDGDGNVNIPGVTDKESTGSSHWSIWILSVLVISLLAAVVYFVFRKKRKGER